MCQCQACGHAGVEMFDICTKCGWENDFSLEDNNQKFHQVGFVLTEEQFGYWSSANGSTPDYFRKNGKSIVRKRAV